MLPGGSDPFYRSILAAGHSHYARIEVWSGTGVRLDTQLPFMQSQQFISQEDGGLLFLDGAVTANFNSRVARNLMLSVPSYMYPSSPFDLLAPFGNEIRAYLGVRLGDGSLKYVWQVFRGRIRGVEVNSAGTCTVTCADRAADVQDVNFESPQNSQTTNTISQEWQRLITDAVPDAAFGLSDQFSKLIEPVTWEFERAAALDEMARSVGALWYPLADGRFVLRRFPWTVASAPVAAFSPDAGGGLVAWSAKRQRDSIFNVVTVTGERLDGNDPVFATASDNSPGSPTGVGGNFGIRSRLERLQQPSTPGGVAGTAQELLRTYIAPTEEWSLEVPPDAALELGDVVNVQVFHDDLQVVTAFTLPLGLSSSMTLSTRSLVVGGVSSDDQPNG